MNIKEIVNRVEDIKEFLTVDEMDKSTFEMAEKYPDLVSVSQVGQTTTGHPLYCLKIGKGKKKAFMYGAPHPNEPIGSMMLEQLIKILCEDPALLEELDCTFHIIKASDADGLRLNEGWLKGPFTYENYAMNFFRPNSPQQVEWTFPIEYKKFKFTDTISETATLMKVMDEVKPDIVYSLHNSSFGGVYFYMTRDIPAITQNLPQAAHDANLPLNMGEPEVPFSPLYAPAVYGLPTCKQCYDFYDSLNLPIPTEELMNGGGSSADYMAEVNPEALVFMCEEPYFLCPDCNDTTECHDMTRKQAIIEGTKKRQQITLFTAEKYEVLKKYVDPKDPYMLSLVMYTDTDFSRSEAQMMDMDNKPEEFDVPVTKASRFDALIGSPWYSLLGLGVVRGCCKKLLSENRLNEEETKEIENVLLSVEQFIHEECQRIEQINPCVPIPVRTLVQVQLQSALIALTNLD